MQGRNRRLVLSNFNQTYEIAMHPRLQPQPLLTQSGRQTILT